MTYLALGVFTPAADAHFGLGSQLKSLQHSFHIKKSTQKESSQLAGQSRLEKKAPLRSSRNNPIRSSDQKNNQGTEQEAK